LISTHLRSFQTVSYIDYIEAVDLHFALMKLWGETRFGVDSRDLIESALARPKHAEMIIEEEKSIHNIKKHVDLISVICEHCKMKYVPNMNHEMYCKVKSNLFQKTKR